MLYSLFFYQKQDLQFRFYIYYVLFKCIQNSQMGQGQYKLQASLPVWRGSKINRITEVNHHQLSSFHLGKKKRRIWVFLVGILILQNVLAATQTDVNTWKGKTNHQDGELCCKQTFTPGVNKRPNTKNNNNKTRKKTKKQERQCTIFTTCTVQCQFKEKQMLQQDHTSTYMPIHRHTVDTDIRHTHAHTYTLS